MMTRNRHLRHIYMFIYKCDEPESRKEGGVIKIYDEPESPNEGGCLRVFLDSAFRSVFLPSFFSPASFFILCFFLSFCLFLSFVLPFFLPFFLGWPFFLPSFLLFLSFFRYFFLPVFRSSILSSFLHCCLPSFFPLVPF